MRGLLVALFAVTLALQLPIGRAAGEFKLRSLLTNGVAMGAACTLNDICSGQDQLCPVDIDTSVGVCPDARAGDSCNSGDMCATSATASATCATDAAAPEEGGTCQQFTSGSTCSGFTGSCSGSQQCNAQITQAAENGDLESDTTVGVCVTPKAAGSACIAGYDLCSGSADWANYFCTSASCPLARPGAACSSSGMICLTDGVYGHADVCSSGTTGSTQCPVTDDNSGGSCPPVALGGSCIAGDVCTAPQVCNTAGTCVDPIRAGATCSTSSSPPDMCIVNGLIYEGGNSNIDAQIGSVCTASTCPFATAGSSCSSALGDLCSSGTSAGVLCSSSECPALPADAVCFLGDDCQGPNQACNAVGASSGLCVNMTAAGEVCTTSYDVCSPYGTLCTTGTCPLADAGAGCNPDDACSSGTKGGALCPEGSGSWCPALPTGLACTSTDACVLGANCIGAVDDGSASGICTPFLKIAASSVQVATNMTNGTSIALTYSNATTVPAVTSVALLGGYTSVAAFNSSERTRFVATLESNIFAKINALVNVTITKVVMGSISVTNSVAFTSADSAAALAGQSALAQELSSTDASSLFGTTFGSVTVSDVAQTNATNPTVSSGAAPAGMTLWTLGLGLAFAALFASV